MSASPSGKQEQLELEVQHPGVTSDEQDLIGGYSLGADSFIRKPIAFAELARAVAHSGLAWLAVKRPRPEES